MGSRLRQNPEKIFEFFAEVARPDDINNQEPFILQTFPTEVSEELKKSVPKFAFPCNFENPAVDLFTFTFTDIDGNYTFGFCRHTAGAHTCLCIISFLPWYEIFYKLLNKIAEILNRSDNNNPTSLLASLLEQCVPDPGEEVCAVSAVSEFSFICPDPSLLPSIPESRNLTEYYNAVDANNMMVIFASMLYERRILITSKKLSRMTACIHGCASLIYPMFWQHLYIPVLPSSLIDYLTAPMPFLIGVHSTLLEKANKTELGDVVILDADKNTVETEYDDLGTLPSEIVSSLKKKLRQQQTDKVHTTMLCGDGVARAFLRTLVNLIGGYRDALTFREGESILFDEEAFINSRPSSVRPFLEKMLHLQIFHQFIEERLEMLNTGEGFSDIFEEETTLMADRGSSSKYKEWMGNMRKHGKKFKREGKDILTGLTSKVKDRSKKAMKDLKSKIDELRKDDDSVPTTLPSVPLKTERPPRPPPPGHRAVTMRTHTGSRRRSSYEKARHYKPIEFDDIPQTTSDDEVIMPDFKHTSVGLMDDPDILNALQKSWSYEDIVNTHESDEDQLLSTSSEDVSSKLPVPAARQSIRKNVSDTALEEKQVHTQQIIVPVAPPRKRRGRHDDAPLITLSSIAPDISDGSDSDDEGREERIFGYEPLAAETKTKDLAKDSQNMNTIERNKVKQLSQMFHQDISKHISEQQTGIVIEPHHVTKPPETGEEGGSGTIERNKVKNLSQMFHQDITKHIIEQQTGKLYEPAYRAADTKPKVTRHAAFRDSHRPVPAKRSIKAKKTEEIIHQLTERNNSNENLSMPSGGESNKSKATVDTLFDPIVGDTQREVMCFEDSFVPTAASLTTDEQETPQLSPNTNLLKEWDLKFDLSPEPSVTATAPSTSTLTSLTTSTDDRTRSLSPQNITGNSLKVHVRGPYGTAGYDANPQFIEVTTYSNQANYTTTPVSQPTNMADRSGNKPQPSTQQTIWSERRPSPNYSAIYSTDLLSASVFTGLDKNMAKPSQGQNFPSTQSTQKSAMYSSPKPFTETVMKTGLYGHTAPNSAPSFGQFTTQPTGGAVLKPQPPQGGSSNSDLFADLDPLKSMVQTKDTPKWETFQ